jgi:hypothetical protein
MHALIASCIIRSGAFVRAYSTQRTRWGRGDAGRLHDVVASRGGTAFFSLSFARPARAPSGYARTHARRTRARTHTHWHIQVQTLARAKIQTSLLHWQPPHVPACSFVCMYIRSMSIECAAVHAHNYMLAPTRPCFENTHMAAALPHEQPSTNSARIRVLTFRRRRRPPAVTYPTSGTRCGQ